MSFPIIWVADPIYLPTQASSTASQITYLAFSPDGNTIYAGGNSYNSVPIWNVTTLGSPSLITNYAAGANTSPAGVARSGNYLFVCYAHPTNSQLTVLDISTPSSPSVAGSLALTAAPHRILIDGSYAYIINGAGAWASNGNALFVVDISSPTSPVLKGTLSFQAGAYPTNLAKSGNYVYVTTINAQERLYSCDVSVPTGPTNVGNIQFSGGVPRSVSVKGNYAYVLLGGVSSNNMKVVDISAPTVPALSGTFTVGASTTAGADSKIYGNALYQAMAGGLYTVDISNPLSISTVDTEAIAGAIYSVDVNSLLLRAALPDATTYLHLYNLQ